MKQFMEMEKDLMEENENMVENFELLNLEEIIFKVSCMCQFYFFFIGIIFNLSCNVKICVFCVCNSGAMEQWKFTLLNTNHKM
jgi:hypothetical protein